MCKLHKTCKTMVQRNVSLPPQGMNEPWEREREKMLVNCEWEYSYKVEHRHRAMTLKHIHSQSALCTNSFPLYHTFAMPCRCLFKETQRREREEWDRVECNVSRIYIFSHTFLSFLTHFFIFLFSRPLYWTHSLSQSGGYHSCITEFRHRLPFFS